MDRFRYGSLVCAMLVGWVICVWAVSAAGAERPNVLFVVSDDLNTDLGVYGHRRVKTPNLDRLAERGVVFDRAYCQYPLCGPSRASFLTGMYPDQTLIRRNSIYVREHLPSVKTLPQVFRDAGYMATRIGKMYHYNVPRHIGTSGHDDPYSWDYTINPRGRDVEEEDLIFTLEPGQFGATLSWLAAEGGDEEQTDGIGVTEAIGMLERHAAEGRSFFLAVGLYRPHTPYVAPKRYFEMYPAESIEVPAVPAGYIEGLVEGARRTVRQSWLSEQHDLDEGLAREAIRAYDASITFADAQVGRLLGALERTGLAENTVVVFTSDHGYHMGEHGHYQKLTLFERAARVPLIVAGPGVTERGKRTGAPVEMVDIYPTIAALCGLETPGTVTGKSLVPVLRDVEARVRESALTQLRLSPMGDSYSIRTERYRYTAWGENGSRGVELYDHREDPDEMVNLAGRAEAAEAEAGLARLLRERVAEARRKPEGLEQIVFENDRRER